MEGGESALVSGPESGGGGGGEQVLMKESDPSPSSLTTSPPPAPESTAELIRGVVGQVPPVSKGLIHCSNSSSSMTNTTTTTSMTAGGVDDDQQLGGNKLESPTKYQLGRHLAAAAAGGGSTALSLKTSSPFFSSSVDLSSEKRGRGRPPGSGKRQLLATLGEWFAYSAGGNFTPHVVTIAAGKDVAARIMSFSLKGPRAICILSANGAISNVTLRQPGSSGGTLTYEGRFEILSLAGSFTITENSGVRSRTGGISVSLAGPDGRVVGGGVAGLLRAASPIQVVVGSFMPNTFKEHKRRSNLEYSSSFLPNPAAIGVLTAARHISQANPDDDCETPTLTLPEQNRGEAESSRITNPNPNSTSFHRTVGWHGLQQQQQQSSSENKPSPDINLSLPAE